MSDAAKSSQQPLALVTGAARRIGAQIARELHARGCKVIVHYRGSAAEAEQLAGELNGERTGSALALAADLERAKDIEQLVRRVRKLDLPLTVLVNNASRFFPTPFGQTTAEDWDALVGSNLRGPFFLVQALLPLLRESGGSVVNLLDIYARHPRPGFTAYCIAKAGLESMTRALALELAPRVRVNGVAPGAILWPEDGDAVGGDAESEDRSAILARVPMQRTGEPDDIARAVAFLALDAPYVTGQVLAVDGGRSLAI